MTETTIARCVAELSEAYSGATKAQEGALTLVKLPAAKFPLGCQPISTAALVVLDPAQEKPRLLVKVKPRTPAGVEPRNVNSETVGGESWFCFSYKLAWWNEECHTAQQFVEGALGRFAKNE